MLKLVQYLVPAMQQWVIESGFTPHIEVYFTNKIGIHESYSRNGKLILNIHTKAIEQFNINQTDLTFKSRFGGVSLFIRVPVDSIISVYCFENGKGQQFPAIKPSTNNEQVNAEPTLKKPVLTIIK